MILLPTRRAARALAEAFLRAADGRPLLLPRITALGALDEAPLSLAGGLDLPAAVEPAARLAALTRLVLAMGGKGGAPRSADRAWRLAAELAALMDEAELAEVDLASRLPDAADPEHAAHWQQTLEFLGIVTRAWPHWLAEQGRMNPAARRVRLLDAQAAAWAAAPPREPVLVAGTTGAVPAVARLLRVVAALPEGAVVLPGLDRGLSDEEWRSVDAVHPQARLRRLLADLGATRGDVRDWPGAPEVSSGVPAGRFATLRTALLPAAAIGRWRPPDGALPKPPDGATPELPPDTAGMLALRPADQQEEAAAIALVLRETLEQPGARAALVTPDRDLAMRVSAELLRYGIVADDSAGEPLAATPPAVFLRLLAQAVAERLAPVPLLALLKHPLAAAGLPPAACREAARVLEVAALRGPRPTPGVAGLRDGVDRLDAARRPAAQAFLARLEACLEPALRLHTAREAAPAALLTALLEAGERLAATDDVAGEARLWGREEGEALATHVATILAVLGGLPDQLPDRLPGLLDAVLEGEVVRTRRALRGREGAEHPRVFIWGLLEARLQSADTIVLAGLTEGVWPPATDPGPWLSRRMRARVGLDEPEARVGQSAHDFVAACCAAARVVLSCPRRRDGAPALPARWLARLDAFLAGARAGAEAGAGGALPQHPAAQWVRALDQPAGGGRPIARPRPNPPLRHRPRRLSVTDIETWLRDPYAVYAKRILRLQPLHPLDESADAARYGQLAHRGLHAFVATHGLDWPSEAATLLRDALTAELRKDGLRDALVTWWAPRFARIALWVHTHETGRRAVGPPLAVCTEIAGEMRFDRPGGGFTLRGRADRIERHANGGLAIIDYKTGTPPSDTKVAQGFSSQLPLEALMAAAGAFGPELAADAGQLAYWHLSGGFEPGRERRLFGGEAGRIAAVIAEAGRRLAELIDRYDDPARCYLAQPRPNERPPYPEYAQLARVLEWDTALEGE